MLEQSAFYRFNMETFEVTVITDGFFTLPSAVLSTNASDGAVSALLDTHYLPKDVFVAPLHVMLINIGDQLILIDTGLGNVSLPGFNSVSGKLLPTLNLLGIHPNDINMVILTHAHPDHIGATVDSQGNPHFLNATYAISQLDWDFWTQAATDTDDQLANYFATVAQHKLLPLSEQVLFFNSELEIVPGITAISAPGHTPGHSAILINSGENQLLHLADTTLHHVVNLQEPGWFAGLDIHPETAAQSRHMLLQRASEERIKVFGYHFPFPGIGYTVRDDNQDSWKFIPSN